MPPKTLFVPKEFSNELTDLIEKNPTVEEVLCHNLLSQTCRNEGQKFLNFFYNPEEMEKETANLPNLDHLIDLALDKDASVELPKDVTNSLGQINRNASNILSSPSKRLRDLAMKDPQRRLFRKLRGFITTKSAKSAMFSGHFQRIIENYLSSYESEFKPQSNEFYQDDFSMRKLIDFMIKHIKILSYRDFLTHFVTTFAKSFPDDSNYALEEILSKAGRYLFALQDMRADLNNQSHLSKSAQNAPSGENEEENESSESGEKSSSDNQVIPTDKESIQNSQVYRQYYQYQEKIQPISIEEKRLSLPIYMKPDLHKIIPPFKELYKEFQLYLEDFQLSHPVKRAARPGLPLPKNPANQATKMNVAAPNSISSHNNKRSTIEPDFFKKNNELSNKKRNQSSTFNIPGLISLDELDPKKRSKQRETQSSYDMINRQSGNNFRRSINLQKSSEDFQKSDTDKSSNCSDSENLSDKKLNGKRKRSHSFKSKTKSKSKTKDEKKAKKVSDLESKSIEEGYLDDDNSKDGNANDKEKNPIIYHYNVTNRRFSSLIDFETTMKDFVHYDDEFKEKLISKQKKNKFSIDIANQSVFFLISLIRNAFSEDQDIYKIFRKNGALLQLLLICGTFSDDESRLASEVFTIIKSIIEGDEKNDLSKDDDSINDIKDNEIKNEDSSDENENETRNSSNASNANSSSSDTDKEGSNPNNDNDKKKKKEWKVPDFVEDFAEYFTFDPYNVTQKMIAAFQIFWNYRSRKYDVYDNYCYTKYVCQSNREKNIALSKVPSITNPNNNSNVNNNDIIMQTQEKDLILDYPSFEGVIYRKPPGKTPLEVMTPVFFTEPPLSDEFNHQVRRILTSLGKKRKKLAGQDITKSEHIEEILQIDIIYIEFMRNTFDLSLDDPDLQRLHVINAIEKMLEMYPCNNNYWQNHNTIARPMLNGHIQKLSRWSMKYDFLVVGKNKELSSIAFLLPGPKVAAAANYAQTTFDIENLKTRFKNKLFKIDLGWPSDDNDDEEEDYGPVSDLDF